MGLLEPLDLWLTVAWILLSNQRLIRELKSLERSAGKKNSHQMAYVRAAKGFQCLCRSVMMLGRWLVSLTAQWEEENINMGFMLRPQCPQRSMFSNWHNALWSILWAKQIVQNNLILLSRKHYSVLIERDTRPVLFQSNRGCCALMTLYTRTEIRLEAHKTGSVSSKEAVNLQEILFVHQEVKMNIICFCEQHHY